MSKLNFIHWNMSSKPWQRIKILGGPSNTDPKYVYKVSRVLNGKRQLLISVEFWKFWVKEGGYWWYFFPSSMTRKTKTKKNKQMATKIIQELWAVKTADLMKIHLLQVIFHHLLVKIVDFETTLILPGLDNACLSFRFTSTQEKKCLTKLTHT